MVLSVSMEETVHIQIYAHVHLDGQETDVN